MLDLDLPLKLVIILKFRALLNYSFNYIKFSIFRSPSLRLSGLQTVWSFELRRASSNQPVLRDN